MEIVVKHRDMPVTQQRQNPGTPPMFRIGENGRVKELHSEDNTVDVLLDSGVFLKRVPVRSKGWVIYQEDSEKDFNAGGRDLPPLHTRVFILMPTGTYYDCFVLCSLFSTPDKAGPFLADDRERIQEIQTPSWWHITNDNDTGSHKAVSPDKKTSRNLDYGSKDDPLDPPELHEQLFHDEKNADPGITLDVVSGKTIDLTAFKEDVIAHHEKGKVIKAEVFEKEMEYTHEKGKSITLIEKINRFFTNKANVKNTIEGNETTDVTKNYRHSSADTSLKSTAPMGLQGTGTELGGGVLQIYWSAETAAWKLYPVIIPPVPLPVGTPVPPAPPLINMALNGIIKAILEMDTTAKANCAKALK